MSTLNVTIGNSAGGSGASPGKLAAYVMHGLALAPSYIYIMRISVFAYQ